MFENKYPLSIPQSTIWMTEKYFGNSPLCNIGGSLIYQEKVDFSLLEKAVQLFIKNNDAVRCAFTIEKGIPYQYIKPYTFCDIPLVNVKDEEAFKTLCKKLIQNPLTITASSLYDFCLFRFPDGSGGLYATFHHIICDAWSMSLFISDISDTYASLKKGTALANFARPSYCAYIKKEKQYLTSSQFQKDATFWKNVFKNTPSFPSFSCNQTPTTSLRANRKSFTLMNSSKIYAFCKQHHIPILTFFLCIFSLYLHSISFENEITLGTPILNRTGNKEKNTFGMFVNTLPLRVTIENHWSFLTFTQEMAKQQFSTFRHHHYPYRELLKYVREKHQFSNPLYDTIISYQNARDNAKNCEIAYQSHWDFCGYISNSLAIHLYDMDDCGQLDIFYDYQLEKFTEHEIEQLHLRIDTIIKQVLANPTILLKDICIVSQKDLAQFNRFNATHSDYDPYETLIGKFEKQVKKTPNHIALQYKDMSITYQELYQNICKLGKHLQEKKITANTPVVLLLDRSIEMIIAMFATLKAGGYYIAIDPAWPKSRIDFILQNSGSHLLLTSSQYVSHFEELIDCFLMEHLSDLQASHPFPTINTPKDLAYILYTSGSTGQPKGTLITNKNVVGLLHATHCIFRQTEKDIWTLFHTYTFDFSTWEIYGALLYGGKLVIVPKDVTGNPKTFLQLLIKEKVTILNQTPAYFYKVIEQEKLLKPEDVSLAIRYIILGGEAVCAKPLKAWMEKYPHHIFYNGYGPTETTVFAIMTEITKQDVDNDTIYIGKPIPNYEIYILNEAMQQLPPNTVGEICISGVGVCNGYFKKPDLTMQKFMNWHGKRIYKTGDIGYLDKSGSIKYKGRNDHQVKIRGFRVELEEIEKQMLRCPCVTKAVVIPTQNANFTQSLVGFFEATTPHYTNHVLTTIKKYLPSYMIPKLYQVKEFPVNANGKVDVKSLLKERQSFFAKTELARPQNSLEEEILSYLSQISNQRDISVLDDFFTDLGLDSLNVMDLAIKLSPYKVEIQDINQYTTVRQLVHKILENTSSNPLEPHLQKDVSIVNTFFAYDLSYVLLTGATGFLGVHLLYGLLQNPKVKKIYCPLREKQHLSIYNRFHNRFSYYFPDNKLATLLEEKVVILNSRLVKPHLGLDPITYHELCSNLTTVIHCAANVRHYGKYEDFYDINVNAVKHILQLCEDSRANLAHISTVSVGAYTPKENPVTMTENDINCKQTFKNVYMLTKYEAECEILKEMACHSFHAKIFRLGNIMPRSYDYKFQINKHQNGFLSRLQTILSIQASTPSINAVTVDMSPVDLCANSILKIIEHPNAQTVYHIFNPHVLSLEKIFESFPIDLNVVNDYTCLALIRKLNSPFSAHLVNDLYLKDWVPTPMTSDITTHYLHTIGFDWSKIDKTYLQHIYELILKM